MWANIPVVCDSFGLRKQEILFLEAENYLGNCITCQSSLTSVRSLRKMPNYHHHLLGTKNSFPISDRKKLQIMHPFVPTMRSEQSDAKLRYDLGSDPAFNRTFEKRMEFGVADAVSYFLHIVSLTCKSKLHSNVGLP
eukprot:TRINITY_DN9855_c0_g1_i1.p1 TRINITY_DN9855_c0_g1~~TRINITY_DN9855_c0_g1_i1.p1  ORF type:complete len:137 (-),score=22.55 TRINITY_DN9855_c0_g1_i1:203-613(-)